MRESWQTFQHEFGRYLRDPAQQSLPAGVPPRRARVYEDLLFNNVCGFLNSCFPVCQQMITREHWLSLCRAFFRDWRCHSPRFNDIPKEFLDFLATDIAPGLPYPWFWQLAHYEWVELAVDTFDETGVMERALPAGHFATNPSLHNLVYDWPVHQIAPDNLPQDLQPSFLLVYRDREDEVCFTEVNAATSGLIHLFQAGETDPAAVLQTLAEQLKVSVTENFLSFGQQMIQQLLEQNVLVQDKALKP